MDEGDDPAAILVAALQEATAAARAAAAVAEAARVAALETQNQLSQEVSDLVKKVDGFEHNLQVMTPRRAALQSARAARYVWAVSGFVIGLIFGVSVLLLIIAQRHPG